MPLSENEQRMLEQMERALYADDPKFATSMKGADLRAHLRKRIVIAGSGFVLGIAALLAGAVSQVVPLAVLGFLLMLGFAWLGVSSWRRIPAEGDLGVFPGGSGGGPAKRRSSGGGIVNRAEERWRRRRDEMGR